MDTGQSIQAYRWANKRCAAVPGLRRHYTSRAGKSRVVRIQNKAWR